MTVRRSSRLVSLPRMNDNLAVSLQGVGIDLVSLRRVKRLTSGRSSIQFRNLLTSSEQKLLKGSPRRRASVLAKIISAKEAFFKAAGLGWIGTHGWREFHVRLLRHGSFSIQTARQDAAFRAVGSFFENAGRVGAMVTLWKSDALAPSR